MSTSASERGRGLPGIEGMRGVAALSVMLAHIAIGLLGGYAVPGALGQLVGLALHGLTLFFVISGFLLYRPYAAAVVAARPRPSTSRFYRNRVLRIAPAYVVIFLISALVLGTVVIHAGTAAEPDITRHDIGRMTDPVLLLLNLTLTQGFVPHGMFTGLNVSWSLVPEVCFYLVLPALGWLGVVVARRLRPVVAVYVPAVVLFLIGAVTRSAIANADRGVDGKRLTFLHDGATWHAVVYRSILTQADLFAFGMLAAAIVVTAGRRSRPAARAGFAVGAILTLGLLNTDFVHPAMALLLASALTLLMLDGGGRLRRTALAALESRPLYRLGLISYSVYLWHFPLLWFVRAHVHGSPYDTPLGLLADLLGVSLLTIACATLTYRFVEAPALARKRPTSTAPATAPEPVLVQEDPRG